MGPTPETIARALGRASRSGDNWNCRCPAHDDKSPSLSVGLSSEGKLLVRCHAGCEQSAVIEALKSRRLWTGTNGNPAVILPDVEINLGTPKGRIVATYDYVSADGEVLYQVVRFAPKDFRQRRPVGAGWSWSVKGVPRVLYRLPEVRAAIAAAHTVYVCEGEKDADAAAALGLAATCNSGGADNGSGSKWLQEFGDALAHADIVVIPDNDTAGEKHAARVVATLGKARRVRVAEPATGKDLADWIAAGATVADIEAAAVEVPRETPQAPEGFTFHDVSTLVSNIQPIQWLVRDYLERDSLAVIYGAPGGGKSFLSVDIAASVATGRPWQGHKVTRGRVFYIAGEGHNGLARRFRAWELANDTPIPPGVLYKSGGAMAAMDAGNVEEVVGIIVSICGDTAPALVVIDTVARNYGPGDENSTADMSKFISNLDTAIRRRFACCVLMVHHTGHEAGRARGSSALKAAIDAEHEITKDEAGTIKLKNVKMKEAELGPDMLFKLRGVEIPGLLDEDGLPVGSAALGPADDAIMSPVAKRGDGSQVLARDVLSAMADQWLSERELGDALGTVRRQTRNALDGLRRYGFATETGLTDAGIDALSKTGAGLSKMRKPVWKQ
jgi:hypothetical protein